MRKLVIVLVFASLGISCNTVKEYDKQYINDPDMKLAARLSERFETIFKYIEKQQQEPMVEKLVAVVDVIKNEYET